MVLKKIIRISLSLIILFNLITITASAQCTPTQLTFDSSIALLPSISAFDQYGKHTGMNNEGNIEREIPNSYYTGIYDGGFPYIPQVLVLYSEPDSILLNGVIQAYIDINPYSINLKNNGKWITAYLELDNVDNINVSTINLIDQSEFIIASIDPNAPVTIVDYDCDGNSELMVKFDRKKLLDYFKTYFEYDKKVEINQEIELTITGELIDGTPFEGSDIVRVINSPKKGYIEEIYDIDANGIPKFVTEDYIKNNKIDRISKFRSSEGHDYSDDFESCISMKHYFVPNEIYYSNLEIFAPVDGVVSYLVEEWAGTQIGIKSEEYPAFTFIIFHVNNTNLNVGENVYAGQKIGTHIGPQTYSDIAIQVNTPTGRKLVSYFDVMTDCLFLEYQEYGLQSRDELIILKDIRDADPLICDGEEITYGGNLENWVYLN